MAVDPKPLAYCKQKTAVQKIRQEQAEAWQELEAIAAVPRQRFGATRLIVFGSLLGDHSSPNSDLDLAAESIPKHCYFEAVASANACSQRWVDLKLLENLAPYFKQRVLDTGMEIHAWG